MPAISASVPSHLDFDADAGREGIARGLLPCMDEGASGDRSGSRGAGDRAAKLGMVPVEVSIPDWPYDSLNLILVCRRRRRHSKN